MWCATRRSHRVHTAQRMTVRRQHLLALAVLAFVVAWSALEASTISELGLLYLAPALVLVVPLLFGRYVGEDQLAALTARPARVRQRPSRRLRLPRSAERVMHRGGRLVAAS